MKNVATLWICVRGDWKLISRKIFFNRFRLKNLFRPNTPFQKRFGGNKKHQCTRAMHSHHPRRASSVAWRQPEVGGSIFRVRRHRTAGVTPSAAASRSTDAHAIARARNVRRSVDEKSRAVTTPNTRFRRRGEKWPTNAAGRPRSRRRRSPR